MLKKLTSMRAMTLTGPAAALGLMDKQDAAGRDTVPSSCFAHRLAKEVNLPSGDSLAWEQASNPVQLLAQCSTTLEKSLATVIMQIHNGETFLASSAADRQPRFWACFYIIPLGTA